MLTPSLLAQTTRLRAELAAVIERSRDLRWWAQNLRSCSASTCRHIICGGAPNDDAALVVSIITGLPLCHDCIARRTGIPLARVDSILTSTARAIVLLTKTQPCAACLETKTTYGLGDSPPQPTRPNGTRQAILNFLGQQPGKQFCAECIAGKLFAGKNIDVALRHLEGNGMDRRNGHCSACGKPRLVASLPSAN